MAYLGKDGSAELQGMISALRQLPELGKRAAPDVAAAVQDELRKTADAGTTPFGQPWLARQADGGRAMKNASASVRVGAVGTTILAIVTGPEARHHKGTARGGIKRQLLPVSGRIPRDIDTAVREVLTQAFDDVAKP
jgi:hypothetical protein